MELDDLRKRLARLGVTQGGQLKPKPSAPADARIESVLDGHIRDTSRGALYEVSHTHEAHTPRGPHHLAEWLEQDTAALAGIANLDPALLPDFRRFIFLDTETTGLGGAGALPFMVGIGSFNASDDFEVHQFFLRDPSEEEALLALLSDLITADHALVTFNGRNFDIPLLSGRYILARQQTHLAALSNLDLLPPARRLWQRRLPSCALSALEADVLAIHRTQADVPGSLIPYLYQQYLQSGDAREMARVFYHNEQDILSMVVLAVAISHIFARPDAPALPVEDRISLARWYELRGMLPESEMAYRLALEEAPDAETRHSALTRFAALLKRLDRRGEAVPLWEFLADLKLDTSGHEELAKYYEWHEVDLSRALAWTERGIALAESWRAGIRRIEVLSALIHRQSRLQRKLSGTTTLEDFSDPDLSLPHTPLDEG